MPMHDAEELKTLAPDELQHRGTSGTLTDAKLERAPLDDEEDKRATRALRKMLVERKQPLAEIERTEEYSRCKRRLTASQAKFMQRLCAGDLLVEAYRKAYNPAPTMTHAQVHARAWHTAKHPVIVLEMKLAADRIKDKAIMNSHKIREHVITRLLAESTQASQDGARIRALELLGKLADVSLFVNKSEVVHRTANPDEMKQLLVSKLYEFFNVNRPPQALPERIINGGDSAHASDSTHLSRAAHDAAQPAQEQHEQQHDDS